MLTSMQYIGESHTFIRLAEYSEKVKVGHGEIVEVEESMVGRLRNAGFQLLNSAKEESSTTEDDEVNYKTLSKPKLAAFALTKGITLDETMTKDQMIADYEAQLAAKEESSTTDEPTV